MTPRRRMLSLLAADPPNPDQMGKLMLFGQFVGSWDLDATFIEDGIESHTTGEWHFDWILQGRAIQDVLVFPTLSSAEDAVTAGHKIGTSIRFYDHRAETWKVVWINPTSGQMYKLTGGKVDDEIILDGDPHDGEPTKWIFSEITDRTFVWRGIVSDDGRATWRLIQEMQARKRS